MMMDRCHLYLPLVNSSGAPYSYAEVTLLNPDTGTPIDEPIYLDPHDTAPQSWPILIDPAVINLWSDRPLRVTVHALLPGGATFTRAAVDMAPAPSTVMRTQDPLRVGSAAGIDGSALLSLSRAGRAQWQVMDGLRFHTHSGAAPNSTAIAPSSPATIYPGQTWLGALSADRPVRILPEVALTQTGSHQQVAFDTVNDWVFATQIIKHNTQLPDETAPVSLSDRSLRGDIAITRMRRDGTQQGVMFVRGAGHGVALSAEPVGTDTWLWIEADATPDGVFGYARKVGRVKWVDQLVLDSSNAAVQKFNPKPSGIRRLFHNVDLPNQRIFVCWADLTSQRNVSCAVYNLTDFKNNVFTPLYEFPMPQTVTGSFQNFCLYGYYLYRWEGHTYSTENPPPGDAWITVTDIRTGKVIETRFVNIGVELSNREPEALTIDYGPDGPRLVLGFSTNAPAPIRYITLYAWKLGASLPRLPMPEPIQGKGSSAVGSQSGPGGEDATLLGESAGGPNAVSIGKWASAGAGSVAVGVQSNAPGSSQVAVGPNTVVAPGSINTVALGSGAVAAADTEVQISDSLTASPEIITMGRGQLDLSWVTEDQIVALLGDVVAPRYLGVVQDAVVAGGSSTLGCYGAPGTFQPLISTSGLTISTPGRGALLSLLSALDSLGLIYLLDGSTFDELTDWSKTISHDPNLILETGDPDGSKGGDLTRIRRNAAGPGSVVYSMVEMKDLLLHAYTYSSTGAYGHASEITVAVSPDNATWTPVPMTWQPPAPTAASWAQTWGRNRFPLPTGMQYLKITLDLNASASTPQLGQVIIRPRSVLSAPTPRVELTSGHTTVFTDGTTYHPSNPIQGLSVDGQTNEIYFAQVIPGGVQLPGESAPVSGADRNAAGDIAITRMSMSTRQVLGVMWVKASGHGLSVAAERDSSGLWLWIGCDSEDGFARALGRVRFQNQTVLDGRTIATTYRPFGTAASHNLSVAIDPAYSRIVVRRMYPDPSSGYRYYLYDLEAFKAGDTAPLAMVDQRANATSPDGKTIGLYQGSTTWGNYLYTLEGVVGADNTYITILDWRTGKVVQRTQITTHPTLTNREPQGLAVWLSSGAAKFAYAFSGGTTSARTVTLTTIDSRVP
ncbi:phage baseplate protein [Streptomyces sp. NPDC054838]